MKFESGKSNAEILMGTAIMRITDISQRVSKLGKEYVEVKGSVRTTYLKAMFFGEDQDWVLQYKKGDTIKVTGRLNVQAMMSQKTAGKQFVSINIFAYEYELIRTAGEEFKTEINAMGTALARNPKPTEEPVEEIDDADLPF